MVITFTKLHGLVVLDCYAEGPRFKSLLTWVLKSLAQSYSYTQLKIEILILVTGYLVCTIIHGYSKVC